MTSSAGVDDLRSAIADRYRIERELGAGGMATVYVARDLKHDRDVALKVLRRELTAILGRERFLNEVRLTARLDHPHILTLIDSGESAGYLWYVLPFIRGESLRDRLVREKQLDIGEALTIARQIGGARLRAPPRHHSPRHQARKHSAARRRGDAGRLRHRGARTLPARVYRASRPGEAFTPFLAGLDRCNTAVLGGSVTLSRDHTSGACSESKWTPDLWLVTDFDPDVH